VKAVVLTAGPGRRFRPLTDRRPKCMLPVANDPLLEHVLEALVGVGVDEVVFVVGHRRERIQNYFQNGREWGVDVRYATQEKPRGTADALLRAESYVDDDFLVLNGDRFVEPPLLERLWETRTETGNACMAVTRVDDPTRYGMVETAGGRVARVVEKPPAHAVTSQLVNAGVYAFGPEAFAAIRRTDFRGEQHVTKALDDHLDDEPVQVVRYEGLWLELTQPWDLVGVNDRALAHLGGAVSAAADVHDDASVVGPVSVADGAHVRPGARVQRGATLGENVRVGANAVVTNSVVMADATVGPGTVLRDCIVGANAHIGPNVTVEGGRADVVVGDTLHTGVKFGGLFGDGATVGGAVSVDPGTVVGTDATAETGIHLSGTVPSGATVTRG
jgi:glucose-1-phosphate thymidylyltransferase